MPIDKTIIRQLLEELQGYVYDLENMSFTLPELEQNRDIQHLVNHRLHTAVEICIDMAVHLASAMELPGRNTAVDVIALLGQQKIIDRQLTERFQQAPKLRNLLIHGYAKVDYRRLHHDYQADLADIKDFAYQIKTYLDQLPE